MKFELKTEKEIYSRSFFNFFKIIFVFSLIIIFCDVSIKLGIISRYYEIKNNCILLTVEKSKSNFENLSKFINLKNKQRIWEFCMKVVR